MRNKKDNNQYYFDFQEQEAEEKYAMDNYRIKLKNRAKNKRQAKFSDRKERDLLPD